MFKKIIQFIKSLYPKKDIISLHEPKFIGNEKKYINNAIDSTFVSSVGEYVNRFEEMICNITGASYSIATVNGTSALHIALKIARVKPADEVITQSLTFIATANAISYCGAKPIFLDVDKETLGLNSKALEEFLEKNSIIKEDGCFNKKTCKKISACLPMHTFGHPCQIDMIIEICNHYRINLIEDAAESLGSTYKGKHTGTFGLLGIYSFNGNKIVTSGGGGMIVTDNKEMASKARHLTTTARIKHEYEFVHDEIGYNYRMPNLNAALGCAQLENLSLFLENKRELARMYKDFFNSIDIPFICEPINSCSNYWLNTILLSDRELRDCFLEATNKAKIMTRPAWRLIHKIEMYKNCQRDELLNSMWLEDRMVNIPSSVPP